MSLCGDESFVGERDSQLTPRLTPGLDPSLRVLHSVGSQRSLSQLGGAVGPFFHGLFDLILCFN